ncbi:macro domain-containing protein [Actinobacillus porcinus]|uniref:type II toxin-antitoxin system antitoxin DNA ADP-ribosyl glycohydrolase DarG n=1 Tax=Actinobacillus porcinus TaxID=51048 RepID=UPI002A90C98B|nr:macro domain-containing protein [Actinobacillus porcinus]MDY6215264.1 macro domain-containing protein [Actinobacillus porcinus]
MIIYTKGNLLDADVDVLVNTVNTVGIMGKGIALMFKERFPENNKLYTAACRAHTVVTGKMFITAVDTLFHNPKWIVNFPTKQHWKGKSKMEWIKEGLVDLKHFLVKAQVRSIAIPPLGAGNGGLDWELVKKCIEEELGELEDISIFLYEPTLEYQNIRKLHGIEELTLTRALISELVRKYWALGIDCSLLEIQKLVWFLQRNIDKLGLKNEMKAKFRPHFYGPYADNINHLLNKLDGSYLLADKRIPDSSPNDVIWFNNEKEQILSLYLASIPKEYKRALSSTLDIIAGFESPFGLELLSTVDWLLENDKCQPNVESLRNGLKTWKSNKWAIERKLRIFTDNDLELALNKLILSDLYKPLNSKADTV